MWPESHFGDLVDFLLSNLILKRAYDPSIYLPHLYQVDGCEQQLDQEFGLSGKSVTLCDWILRILFPKNNLLLVFFQHLRYYQHSVDD